MKRTQEVHPFFTRFLESSIEDELDDIKAGLSGDMTGKYPSDDDVIDPMSSEPIIPLDEQDPPVEP